MAMRLLPERVVMAKKKNQLRPITVGDMVAGQTYIKVGVDMHGALFYSSGSLHGQPRKYRRPYETRLAGTWWVKTTGDIGDKLRQRAFLPDLGMSVGPNCYQTWHRVFRHTQKNADILKNLVANQSLAEYLKTIGFPKPGSEIIKIQDRAAKWERIR